MQGANLKMLVYYDSVNHISNVAHFPQRDQNEQKRPRK